MVFDRKNLGVDGLKERVKGLRVKGWRATCSVVILERNTDGL